jgi:hypothetical protein
MKLLFTKQNYNVLSPSSYTLISLRDLYIFRIGLPILLQGNTYVVRFWEYTINCSQTHECEICTEATQFPEKEYLNAFFLAMSCKILNKYTNKECITIIFPGKIGLQSRNSKIF